MTNFEKALKEKLSPETYALISADEQVFGKWIERLKNIAEGYVELVAQMERMKEHERNLIQGKTD